MPEQGEPGGWLVTAMYLSMGQEHDYRKFVSRVHVPTLIIRTGKDFVQSEAASKTYLEVFKDADYKSIDAGHHDQMEQVEIILGRKK